MTAAERLFEVIDSQPEQLDDGSLKAMRNITGEVKFHNVTFGYDSHKPVLKDINLHVQPGEMIGLVGHSGAGKSTLINLICRFYTPDSGQLEIDGEDIRQINLKDLRQQIGVVLQGSVSVQWHDSREHRLRASGCLYGGYHRSSESGECPRIYRQIPRRL